MVLSPHPSWWIITDYDPNASCEKWFEFLSRIMDGNEQLISFLQRAIGYALSGETSEQCLFIFHGSGRPERPTATPPQAMLRPVSLEKHGDVRTDNYFWLRERENPEVIAYLEAENAYTDTMMSHTKQLQESLFEEIKGRIKQTDMSVPYRRDGYFYYTRMEDQKEYPIFCRKKGSLEGDEEVMVDANIMAQGHAFSSVGIQVSPSQDLVAITQDTTGRRFYRIRVKNLVTGEMLADDIPATTGSIAWANDNKTFFYRARSDNPAFVPNL